MADDRKTKHAKAVIKRAQVLSQNLSRHKLRRRDIARMQEQPEPTALPKFEEAPPTEPLTILCWKWRSPGYHTSYSYKHVNVLKSMVERNYVKPHRFVCITDDPIGIDAETFPIWDDLNYLSNPSGRHLPSCFRRLKIFSEEFGEKFGPRIVSLDLDTVITGNLATLWDRPEPFVGWKVPGFIHRVVYNGSMFMFRAGTHTQLWTEFNPETSPTLAKTAGYAGSDQGWISYRIRDKSVGWTHRDGVFSYPREVRPMRRLLPFGKIVMFHGKRKPWEDVTKREAPWIEEHWR